VALHRPTSTHVQHAGWSAFTSSHPGHVPNKIQYQTKQGATHWKNRDFPKLKQGRHGHTLSKYKKKSVVNFLSQMFPGVETKVIEEKLDQHQQSIGDTVDALLMRLSGSGEYLWPESKPDSDYDSSEQTNARKLNIKDSGLGEENIEEESRDNSIPHTEKSNDIYLQCRFPAIRALRERDNLYTKATKSYEAGNHRLAQQQAEEAKHQSQLAYEYNKQAAKKIFRYYNAGLGPGRIDLHGLHVNESLEYLQERLIKLSADDSIEKLTVITGVGKHQAGNAMIGPAVVEYLNDNYYKFLESQGKLDVVTKKNSNR